MLDLSMLIEVKFLILKGIWILILLGALIQESPLLAVCFQGVWKLSQLEG